MANIDDITKEGTQIYTQNQHYVYTSDMQVYGPIFMTKSLQAYESWAIVLCRWKIVLRYWKIEHYDKFAHSIL